MSNKKFKKIWSSILAMILIITVVINFVMLQYFSVVLDMYFGKGNQKVEKAAGSENWDSEYYKSDYDSDEEIIEAAAKLSQQIEGEGIVLLKNNNKTLPLMHDNKKISNDNISNISLFGRTTVDPIYSGIGSGEVGTDCIDFNEAFEKKGFEINNTLYEFYAKHEKSTKSFKETVGGKEATYTGRGFISQMGEALFVGDIIAEVPVADYSDDVIASYDNYNDAAIVVIGRVGGEGCDLPVNMTDHTNYDEDKDKHYLELNKDELDMLKHVKDQKDRGVFNNIIVILNTVNAMEVDFINNEEYGIDAALWVGSYGEHGLNSVVDVITGDINPSGRLVDTYVSDLTLDPTYVNLGDTYYTNVDGSIRGNESGSFIQYEEGIYLGYRYYETAAHEEYINYDEVVIYPFGYGLSYSDFTQEFVSEPSYKDGVLTFEVKVTNSENGIKGKDVVQIYCEQPYINNGVEKSKVILSALSKTKELEPGESQILTLTIDEEELASYDYKVNKSYVLDEGIYKFYLSENAHSWSNIQATDDKRYYEIELSEVIYNDGNNRDSDNTTVTNQFDDVSNMFKDGVTEGYATNMSRSDFIGTYPTELTENDKVANEDIKNKLESVFNEQNDSKLGNVETSNIYTEDMPQICLKNGLNLIDLRGADYNDESWNQLLDQLSIKEMTNLIETAGYNTAEILSISKPATLDYDGPLGWSTWVTASGKDALVEAFPASVVLASTWNVELAEDMGKMIGEQGLRNDFNGWYAPGVNIHRSAFSGRNYEYYSEDGYLSGKIAAATVSGAASKGTYCYLKHFALNDQEDGRRGIATWANEQAIREIYLRPFEICVKEAKAEINYIADEDGNWDTKTINATTAIMSSYNCIGTTWAGGNYNLLNNVLRGEWGFEGVVITDYYGGDAFMDSDQGVRAGSDIYLNTFANASLSDTESATAVAAIRKATHNTLYTVVNSNTMQGISPGTIISYSLSTWKVCLIIVDIAIMIGIFIGIICIRRRIKKNSDILENV